MRDARARLTLRHRLRRCLVVFRAERHDAIAASRRRAHGEPRAAGLDGIRFSLTPGFGRSFQVTTPTKLAEDSPEDIKYKTMIVNPDGTIIRIGGPEVKQIGRAHV